MTRTHVSKQPTGERNAPSPLREANRAAELLLHHINSAAEQRDIPAFRLAAARSVVEKALEEVRSLLSAAPYARDLSLDEAFIARTRHLFAAASAVYATSVDRVSSFWISPQHRAQAEAYAGAQPANTIRLFVFASPASAHEHRKVLSAHAKRYNHSGAVLLCPISVYARFLASFRQAAEPELLSRDFALLVYNEAEAPRMYEATLSDTTLSWLEHPWASTSPEAKLIAEFSSLKKIAQGQFNDGFLRWHSDFASSNAAWQAGLEKLFLSPHRDERELQDGDIFHIVFLAVDSNQRQLTETILQEVKGKLELLVKKDGSARLVKELWFGSRNQSIAALHVHDGRYQGTLNTRNSVVNKFPFCIVVKFSNIDDLKEYYQHEVHSDVRQSIYSLCSEDAKDLYELINDGSSGHPVPSKLIYQAIETAVADKILRADYVERDTIEAIVQRPSAPFVLPNV